VERLQHTARRAASRRVSDARNVPIRRFGVRLDELCVRSVDALGERLVLVLEEVPLAVEGGRDRPVPEVALDGLRVCALGDQERGAGVSERVEAHVG
jgi:hypothetical protein